MLEYWQFREGLGPSGESLQLGLCLVTSLGWGCGMLKLCSKAQGRQLEGRGGGIGRQGKEKGPRADSLMLWPGAQVLSSWPRQRRNGCKTSQSVSKWEECQPWFLMPKEWKINNNHSYDLRSSCFIPKHFTERLCPGQEVQGQEPGHLDSRSACGGLGTFLGSKFLSL